MQRAPESNGSGIANSAKRTCQEGNLTSCMMTPAKRKKKKKMALQAHHISPNYTSWSATSSYMCKSSLNTHTSGMKDPGDPSGNESQCVYHKDTHSLTYLAQKRKTKRVIREST